MAERKATNKYYPPDWNPSKGSINKFRGSHPLRERAKKINEGILVIRFELPFNIWCDGCNNHIGMGVRYNAEKSKLDMYYTTPIYKFRMKCHLCNNFIEIKNDPKNFDYIVMNGARRQENRWDPTENEQIDLMDKNVSKKLKIDPMFKLENEIIDKKKSVENKNQLNQLEKLQLRLKDDYKINSMIRKKFRLNRNELKLSANNDYKLLKKSSLPITMNLLQENDSDRKMAKLMKLQSKRSAEQDRIHKRKQIMNQTIFGKIQSPIEKFVNKKINDKKIDDKKKSKNDTTTIVVLNNTKKSINNNNKSIVNYDDDDNSSSDNND